MELICPSCEARYQVPDGSIGEKGRQVSCMNCGHGWHAFPPLMLSAATQPHRTTERWQDAGGDTRAEPGAPRIHGTIVEKPPVRGAVEATGEQTQPRSESSRSEQLAEIREMLAEVQTEAQVSNTKAPAAPEAPEAPRERTNAPDTGPRDEARALFDEPADRRPSLNEEIHHDPTPDSDPDTQAIDPLRRRMEMQQKDARKDAKQTDMRRLRRRHERRERQRTRANAAGSGAFLTGFLLIVMVAAVMVALYMLKPQIVERLPGMEPAMAEYVETIDGVRVSVAETFENVKGWFVEQTDKG